MHWDMVVEQPNSRRKESPVELSEILPAKRRRLRDRKIITVRKNNMAKDPANPYIAINKQAGNDPGQEIVQFVIDWYRGHRNLLSSTEATNIGTAVTNIH